MPDIGMAQLCDGGGELALAGRWPVIRDRSSASGCVRFVRTAAEMERIGRLRYQRFVIDQGQQYAASGQNVLIDPIDRLSLNLFVDGARCISMAVRLSWAADVVATEYLAALVDNLPTDIAPARTIICSRLIASTAKQGELARLVVLFRRGFEIGLMAGCTHSVLSTLPHRIPLFEKFGYRRTGICIEDRIAGAQEILLLDINDQRHLESVGSPFAVVRSKVKTSVGKAENPHALHPPG